MKYAHDSYIKSCLNSTTKLTVIKYKFLINNNQFKIIILIYKYYI